MSNRYRGALLCSALLLGCGDDPKLKPELAVSASGAPAHGPDLGGQLGSAADNIEGQKGKPPTADQPPPTGIFAPGLADKAFAAGTSPKLELIAEGSDPKIQLLAGPFEEVQTLGVQVELEGALPALIAVFEIGPPKAAAANPEPEKDKGKPGAKPSASAAPVAPVASPQPMMPKPAGDYPLVATLKSISVAAGAADKDAAKLQVLLDLMKGATISFTMTKTGPKSFTRAIPHKPDGEAGTILDLELAAIEDGISALYAPAPDKPVGEGASWVVTDRRTSFGSEVVRYRHFQLAQIRGDAAVLVLGLRQYAVNEKSAFVPPPDVIDQYGSKAEGKLQMIPQRHFPVAGGLKFEMQSMIVPEEAKGNPNAQHRKFNVRMSLTVKPGEQPGQSGEPGKPGNPGDPKKTDGKGKPPAPKPSAPPAP